MDYMLIDHLVDELLAINGFDDPEEAEIVLRNTQPYVSKLRRLFNCSNCHVDYNDANLRAAYMIAYYPFYIENNYN